MPDTYLPCYLNGSGLRVSRHDFHLDTRLLTLVNSIWNILANRITNRCNALQREILQVILYLDIG